MSETTDPEAVADALHRAQRICRLADRTADQIRDGAGDTPRFRRDCASILGGPRATEADLSARDDELLILAAAIVGRV